MLCNLVFIAEFSGWSFLLLWKSSINGSVAPSGVAVCFCSSLCPPLCRGGSLSAAHTHTHTRREEKLCSEDHWTVSATDFTRLTFIVGKKQIRSLSRGKYVDLIPFSRTCNRIYRLTVLPGIFFPFIYRPQSGVLGLLLVWEKYRCHRRGFYTELICFILCVWAVA